MTACRRSPRTRSPTCPPRTSSSSARSSTPSARRSATASARTTRSTSAGSSTSSASSSSAAGPCCWSRCSRRPGSSGPSASRVAKILENMEIGHNILHGQWDWMRDPKIHSTTWEWDMASPAEQWKHSHNELHHTYTNVIGKDNDLGYGIMRVDEDQRVAPALPGPAAVELRQRVLLRVRDRRLRPGARQEPGDEEASRRTRSSGPPPRQVLKQDPQPGDQGLRGAPAAVRTVVPADPGRQLHRQRGPQPLVALGDHVRPLPRGRRDLREDARSRARPAASGTCARCWARPTSPGSKAMHLMTGNLSHQVEHHLFPDLPSNRYAEIAPKVKDIFDRYGLTLPLGPAAQAGRERLAQGHPAVAAQRLARGDDGEERPGAAREARTR